MTTSATTSCVSFDALHTFTRDAFLAVGLGEADALTGADVLATTDAWGVFTHGTKCLAGYLRRLKAGGLRPAGTPRIVGEGGAWATVDGDSSLGLTTSAFAVKVAIAKAKQQGIAYVGVRNSCHFGAAGYYTWLAAREGLIGISMANDIPSVAAPGSRGAITGSNPISYAVPAGRYRPMLLDMSTATVAGGKVYAARMRGEAIPANWLVDAQGRPTTDPSCYPQEGALQPAAGHKGYGISLLIETLSGILTGAGFTWRIGSWMWDDGTQPTHHGAAFIVVDTNAIMPAALFASRMEALIDEIHAAPVADGANKLRVPGEIEWERYAESMRTGIHLPEDVLANLRKAGEISGQNPGWLK
ncbi:MAG: Ldh family oxidoreductase [Verrucomicrobia bacterium]|nr:Ldh family oxidoreductase [Verrucomicrobiota bacterium]